MIDARFAKTGCLLLALVSLASFSVAGHSRSPSSAAEDREIAQCIRLAAGGKLWLEKTLWGLRDQEGGWVGAAVKNANGTRDLGPLQINSWWVPRIAVLVRRPTEHVTHWLRNDPCFNAQAARWIFMTALATTGDYWKAIGVYHSPTQWRQRRYAASVAGKLQRRFGIDLFGHPIEGGRGR